MFPFSGENGHQPAVRHWDVKERSQIHEFHGHSYGISCVGFSGDSRWYLLFIVIVIIFFSLQLLTMVIYTNIIFLGVNYGISIGLHHDMMINVWHLKSKGKVASNKISTKVESFSVMSEYDYEYRRNRIITRAGGKSIAWRRL